MRFRRLVALLLMFSMSACWRYQEVGALPDPVNLPPQSRVHIYDGEVVSFQLARLEADTIRGTERGTGRARVIPLAAVDLIEAKQFQVIDSILFGTAVIVLFYFSVRGISNRPIIIPDGGTGAGLGTLVP